MKNKQLRLRMSERRFNKLQLYAATHDKTMTQIVEELIDSLDTSEIDKNSTVPFPVNPTD
jgi:putative heme iron utilization protein